MIDSKFAFLKNAHIMWAFFVLAAILGSTGFMYGKSNAGWLAISSISLLHITHSEGRALARYRNTFAAITLIFFYALIVSNFKARSAMLCMQIFTVFYLFCTLADIKLNENRCSQLPKFRPVISYIVLFAGLIQAFALAFSYFSNPVRATGLFLDYSQASFFILLCFGLAYPVLRDKNWAIALVFILFLGFFTTFSRSSNFLLGLLLLFVLLFEIRNFNKLYYLKLIGVITLAGIVVYGYPSLIEAELVNRRGFSDLATMNSRVYYWQFAIDAIKDNPLWGYGPGNYEYLGAKEQRPYELITWAHNDYLQVWVALGLFWALAFVASIVFVLIKFLPLELFNSNPIHVHKYLAWSLFVCIALYMLINFIVFAMPFQILVSLILVELFVDEQN